MTRWLFVLLLLISGVLFLQTKNIDDNKRIHDYIIPIKYNDPHSPLDDLAPLKELLKDKTVIALGEATHGSSEVFKMKHKLIRFLVEELGFHVFAIEGSMEDAYDINLFINTGEGSPEQLLGKLGFWTWKTQEIVDLLNWMFQYNLKHPQQKIQFYGFDFLSPFQLNKNMHQLSGKTAELDALLNVLFTTQRSWAKYYRKQIYVLPQSLIDSSYNASKEIYNYMDTTRNQRILKMNGYERIKKTCDLLNQYNTFNSSFKPESGYRDSCMAENIRWILNQSDSSKIILWAHNGHVKRAERTMGQFLDNWYNNKMVVFGFSLYEGTYTAINRQTNALDTNNILALPDSSCYEYYFNEILHDAAPERYIIDLKGLCSDSSIKHWLDRASKFREIGSMSRKEQFFKSTVEKEYDMIICMRKSHGSLLLHNN